MSLIIAIRSNSLPVMIKNIVKIFFIIALLHVMTGAVSAHSAETGRYQVVTSGAENAYLVDTKTGFTWILSYRTLPTGREPVAIPYKFIGVSPQNQGNFLTETAPVFPDSSKVLKKKGEKE